MANENTLTFIDGMSLASFLRNVAHSDDVDIRESADGKGEWFVARSERGAISKSINYEEPIMVSKVHEEGKPEEAFWMMHNKSMDDKLKQTIKLSDLV